MTYQTVEQQKIVLNMHNKPEQGTVTQCIRWSLPSLSTAFVKFTSHFNSHLKQVTSPYGSPKVKRNQAGARFSKARKLYRPVKPLLVHLHLKKQLCNCKVRDFTMALRARKVPGFLRNRPQESCLVILTSAYKVSGLWAFNESNWPRVQARNKLWKAIAHSTLFFTSSSLTSVVNLSFKPFALL